MGMMMRVIRLTQGILDDSGLLDLAGQLEHGVEGAAAGEGDVLDGAYDDEQSIGIEEVDVLIGKQDEEGRPHGDGGHEVGRKAMEFT